MIDEIMLALGSPGMVSIVIIPLLLRGARLNHLPDANLLIAGAIGMPKCKT
jgi:hypothetical protein